MADDAAHWPLPASLERLSVRACALPTLPAPLWTCTALLALDVADNGALRALPARLTALGRLEQLGAARCALESLPPALEQLSTLVALDVRHNALTALPPALATFAALRTRGAKLLLAELPYLHALLVDGNPLAGAADVVVGAEAHAHSAAAAGDGASAVKTRHRGKSMDISSFLGALFCAFAFIF